jgi:hypothetical protein
MSFSSWIGTKIVQGFQHSSFSKIMESKRKYKRSKND